MTTLLRQGRKTRLSKSVAELADRQGAFERVDFEAEPLIEHDGRLMPFHSGQKLAWSSMRRIIAVFKGWQAGGTLIGAPWLLREMQRRGPGDYAVITPTVPLMVNKARPELLKTFRGLIHKSGDEYIVTPEGAAKIWGDSIAEGRILLRTAHTADSIEAFTAKAIWVDEPGQISDLVWESIQARGAVMGARILLTSRPYWRNWYVTKIWEAVVDARCVPLTPDKIPADGQIPIVRRPGADDEIDVVCFSSIGNPSFPRSEFAKKMASMAWWRFVLKYLGVPTKAAGMVYDCLDEKVNIHPRFPIPNHWKRVQGVDFGPVNMASVWFAIDPESDPKRPTYYLYSAYHQGRIAVATHVKNWIRRMAKMPDGSPRYHPCGGGAPSENEWRQKFADEGYAVNRPSDHLLDVGIQALYTLLAEGRLKIFSDLTAVLEALWNYVYEVDAEGEPDPSKIVDKTQAHLADSCRYCALVAESADEITVHSPTRADSEERRERETAKLLGLDIEGESDGPGDTAAARKERKAYESRRESSTGIERATLTRKS